MGGRYESVCARMGRKRNGRGGGGESSMQDEGLFYRKCEYKGGEHDLKRE